MGPVQHLRAKNGRSFHRLRGQGLREMAHCQRHSKTSASCLAASRREEDAGDSPAPPTRAGNLEGAEAVPRSARCEARGARCEVRGDGGDGQES